MLEGGQRSWKFAVPPAAIGFVAGNARLRDRVADNAAKNDITERESLLIGRDFGVRTDIETALNGSLFVGSLTKGAQAVAETPMGRSGAPPLRAVGAGATTARPLP